MEMIEKKEVCNEEDELLTLINNIDKDFEKIVKEEFEKLLTANLYKSDEALWIKSLIDKLFEPIFSINNSRKSEIKKAQGKGLFTRKSYRFGIGFSYMTFHQNTESDILDFEQPFNIPFYEFLYVIIKSSIDLKGKSNGNSNSIYYNSYLFVPNDEDLSSFRLSFGDDFNYYLKHDTVGFQKYVKINRIRSIISFRFTLLLYNYLISIVKGSNMNSISSFTSPLNYFIELENENRAKLLEQKILEQKS